MRSHVDLDGRAMPRDVRLARVHGLAHKRLGRDDTRGGALSGLEARKLQHPLHRFTQPARFGLDRRAVGLHPSRIPDHAVREVSGRRVDDGHRRAQFVRHGGDELHLLPRQRMGPSRRPDDEADGDGEQQQDSGTEKEVAQTGVRHGRIQRPGLVRDEQPPVAFATRQEPGLHGCRAFALGCRLDHVDHDAVGRDRERALPSGRAARLRPLTRAADHQAGWPCRQEIHARVVARPHGLRGALVRLEHDLRLVVAVHDGDPVLGAAVGIKEMPAHDRGQHLAAQHVEVERDDRKPEQRHVGHADPAPGTRFGKGHAHDRGHQGALVAQGVRRDHPLAPVRRRVTSGGPKAIRPQAREQRREGRRPLGGLERQRRRVPHPERERRQAVVASAGHRRLHGQVEVLDEVRRDCRRGPSVVPLGDDVPRVPLQGGGVHLQSREGLAQLAVHFERQLLRRDRERPLHAFVLALAQLAEPPVLQHREHRHEHQNGQCKPSRDAERRGSAPHNAECSTQKQAGNRASARI